MKLPFCRLQLVVETNPSEFDNVPKVVKPTIQKSLYKNSAINSPMAPPSLSESVQLPCLLRNMQF